MTDSEKNESEKNPLLVLFRSELLSNVDILEKKLEEGLSAANFQKVLDELAKALHKIKGGAKIAQCPLLAELAGAQEENLGDLQKNPTAFSQQQINFLLETVQMLKMFGKADLSTWGKLTIDQSDKCIALIQNLKNTHCKAKPNPTPQLSSNNERQSDLDADLNIDPIMLDLFRAEVEAQTTLLNQSLVDFENTEKNVKTLEALMRAAHSIKGAARVLRLDPIVHLAHAIEDCFVAVQKGELVLLPEHIDIILHGVDLLAKVKSIPQDSLKIWMNTEDSTIQNIVHELHSIIKQPPSKKSDEEFPKSNETQISHHVDKSIFSKSESVQDRVLRVTAQNLNRLMGLAGESLVESRWLQPFSNSLLNVKKALNELSMLQDRLRETLDEQGFEEKVEHHIVELQHKINESSQGLSDRLTELDMFILRHSSLSDRLYREVVDIRMRPFADGIEAFPRMVRDLARMLNKKVRLEVIGKSTPVDRDILDKLEAPLSHLIRNAVDHGIEPPEIRVKLGKSPEGVIKVEAMHRAGMLSIAVSDDGKGIDLNDLRTTITERNLVKPSMAANFTDTELLDFLFLPGFSTAADVNEISGRGVGLNVVQNMLQEVSGTVRASANPGKGMSFQLLLPLTLSVIRALIVEISDEPYAFPLSRIDRAITISKEQVEIIEDHLYFKFEGQNVGLVPAAQVLELNEKKITTNDLPVIIISDHINRYGIVVDKFLGERELVVLELDPRLGKVADISSGALMEDGSPVLIVDIEDLVRSIDNILSGGNLHKLGYAKERSGQKKKKRVLVIDDSITVREVECRLLQNKGYDVLSAVNGIDGLNALRMGNFDLVITDVDMPRMNGIELVRLIRNDPKLNKLPIMIVSYKERAEDRLLGLEAGANYYLTKGSFNDESLLNAVVELIGEPDHNADSNR